MASPLPLSILAGVIGGAIFLALLGGVPGAALLVYAAPFPILIAGLSLGSGAAAVAGTTATVLVGLISGGFVLLLYALTLSGPSVFVVRQSLLKREAEGGVEWYPLGRVLAALTAYGAGGILLLGLLFANEPEGLLGVMDQALAGLIAELGADGHTAAAALEPARDLLWLLPALTVVSWLIMLALNGIAAQAIAARRKVALRSTPSITEITVPRWCLLTLLTGAFGSLLGDGSIALMAQSVMIVFLVPYLFSGLGVVHLWLRRWPNRGLVLGVFYAALLLFAWPLCLVVAVLGLIDDWVQLRQRIS